MARAPSWIWVRGPWGSSIARRPCPQRVPAVCMGFGSCTVAIFSSPAMATLAGQASSFLLLFSLNPNPMYHCSFFVNMEKFSTGLRYHKRTAWSLA
ncbi:hypothetical protein EDC04DRAFT_1990595 [Pisolithus marmoratus]|nr:hypothetical protein EDC04DRAFT_1990595 [Pisolithus marmoratus]